MTGRHRPVLHIILCGLTYRNRPRAEYHSDCHRTPVCTPVCCAHSYTHMSYRATMITIEIDDEDEKEEESPLQPMPVRDEVVPPGYRRRHAFESPFFDDPVSGLRPVTPPSSDDDDEVPQQQEESTEDVDYDRLFDEDLTGTRFSQTDLVVHSTSNRSSMKLPQWKPLPMHESSVWGLLMELERKIDSGQASYDKMEAHWLARLAEKYTRLEKKQM
jgi:hypothetical protein